MYTCIYLHICTPLHKSEYVSGLEDAVKVAPQPAPLSCRMVCFVAQYVRKMAVRRHRTVSRWLNNLAHSFKTFLHTP